MLATRPDTDTIAITRTFDGIEEAAHRIIEQVGGMESVIRGAKIAILKPNFVAGRNGSNRLNHQFCLAQSRRRRGSCLWSRTGSLRNSRHRV